MTTLKKLGAILGGVAGLGVVGSAVLVGCGDDTILEFDDATVDGALPDGNLPDRVTPTESGPGDGGTDAATDGDAAPPDLNNFPEQMTTAMCDVFKRCCAAQGQAAFDFAKCSDEQANGWEFSLTGVGTARDAGAVTFDEPKARECLQRIAALSCDTVASADYKAITAACFAAAIGKKAANAPCTASLECAPGHYCGGGEDGGGTTCQPLRAVGTGCTERGLYGNDECSYRSSGASCGDNSKECEALRIDGAECTGGNECQSGICACVTDPDFVCTCSQSIRVISPPNPDAGDPGLCRLYLPDAGP